MEIFVALLHDGCDSYIIYRQLDLHPVNKIGFSGILSHLPVSQSQFSSTEAVLVFSGDRT